MSVTFHDYNRKLLLVESTQWPFPMYIVVKFSSFSCSFNLHVYFIILLGDDLQKLTYLPSLVSNVDFLHKGFFLHSFDM